MRARARAARIARARPPLRRSPRAVRCGSILVWDEGTKEAWHAPEGFTHGASAALRGMDMRYDRASTSSRAPDASPSRAVPRSFARARARTHGLDSLAHGLGPLRYYWDSSNLKLTGAVRFSPAALIGWAHEGKDSDWAVPTVHGGCIEMCLDELTAEVRPSSGSSPP